MYHVRLIYNTNFSRTKFKDIDVFELWNKFDSVSVGASLTLNGIGQNLCEKAPSGKRLWKIEKE